MKTGVSPRRARRRGRRISLLFKFLVFAGILLAIILLYIHRKQPPPFTERVKAVDQLLLAQLSQLEIPEGNIKKQGTEQQVGTKTWTLSRWEIALPQGVEVEQVTAQLAQRIQAACPGVTVTEAKAQDGT
ncbi:MAG: hypothetical protein MUP30_11575, partial [Deltaproteobacteria bacterium]|nr:hypothetical protein [Deltaproteobacteria bacterium]